MKIALIRIRNILGIDDIECRPGAFNEITGANGVNKSNFLAAIKSVIEGGHDATLLRNGAAKGEVVLVLDDGVELKKTVTAKASRVEVKKGEVVMNRPMDTIAGLTDLFSVNPIAFLTAPKANRARVLLETMPVQLDRAKLRAIVGSDLPDFQPGMHATAILDAVRKMIFDARTGANRARDDKRSTIEQLRRAMPPSVDGISDASEDDLEAELAAIDAATTAEIATLKGKVDAWMAQKDERVAAMKSELDARIDDLRAQIARANTEHQEAMAEIQQSTADARDRAATRETGIREKAAAAREPLRTRLATIRANRDAVSRREVTLATIKTLSEEASLLEAESVDQTAALKAIDDYRLELLAHLPIPNLEVVDGEIVRDGVPFDRLNTAQRTDIAIEIAKLRAGKLGCVCVDGLELLDPDAYEHFQRRAIDSGLQFFVTRVSRGGFQVNTH